MQRCNLCQWHSSSVLHLLVSTEDDCEGIARTSAQEQLTIRPWPNSLEDFTLSLVSVHLDINSTETTLTAAPVRKVNKTKIS